MATSRLPSRNRSLTFEEESGIDIEYTADQDFTTTIVQKVGTGQAPDIGLFPQPGGLLDLTDDMTPLEDVIDMGAIEETLIPGFLEAATKDGSVYGAPMRMAVKSIVWYPKPAYEDAGYPTEVASYQELIALSEQIASDGTPPWCMGWESDQATGWVGTDWLEEMVLRIGGPDVYDQWVKHEIPFDDPAIVEALDAYGEIAKNEDLVLGGVNGILNTGFADAMTTAFDAKPGCYLMRQGNFATGFFPDEIQADLDANVGTYYFPHYDGGYDGDPVLGGGDLAAVFTEGDDDVDAVMEFLTSDQFGGPWAAAGGWLSPHSTFDTSPVRRRDDAGDRRVGGQRGRLPVRRFRPDARGRRFGQLLDRHGRMDQRPVERGNAQGHRRVVAELVTCSS